MEIGSLSPPGRQEILNSTIPGARLAKEWRMNVLLIIQVKLVDSTTSQGITLAKAGLSSIWLPVCSVKQDPSIQVNLQGKCQRGMEGTGLRSTGEK